MVDSDDTCSSYDDSLVTPALDLTGYTSVSLSFDHYFNNYSTDTAAVSVSTDGTNYTTLQTWTADTSGHVDLDLSAYAGQSTVYVSFDYVASCDWYWMIDSVLVSGS